MTDTQKENRFCRAYERKLEMFSSPMSAQALMNQTLKQVFPNHLFSRNSLVFVENYGGFRVQFVCEELMTIVEVLEPESFSSTKSYFNTVETHDFLKNGGYKVVAVPYFIQLDQECMETHFEGLPVVFDNYKKQKLSGFIGRKTLLPADFTSIGIQRFIDSLVWFESQSVEVIESFIYQQIKYGKDIYEIVFAHERNDMDCDIQDMIYYRLYESKENYMELAEYFFQKRAGLWEEDLKEQVKKEAKIWVDNTLEEIFKK